MSNCVKQNAQARSKSKATHELQQQLQIKQMKEMSEHVTTTHSTLHPARALLDRVALPEAVNIPLGKYTSTAL